MRTPYSQARTTTKLPYPATSTTPFGHPMAEATSRKSITELATPRRTHQDQAFQPRTFYHDCGVRCEGYAISHHWRFNKRHTNAPPSQAATNGTSVMVRGVDAIHAIRSYQYPGPGKSASSLIAATKTRQLTASHPQPRRRNPTTLRNEGPNAKIGSKQYKVAGDQKTVEIFKPVAIGHHF